MKKIIANEADVKAMLDRLACEIVERYPNLDDYCLIGIKTRGVHIAKRLQERIEKITGKTPAMGELDITFYRDDLTLVAQDPQMKSTALGADINGKVVILADDVLYSGKTLLCALNALAQFGRAEKTVLLVMVDRGHHKLPVHSAFTGRYVHTEGDDIIHVHLKEKDGDDCIVHNIGGQQEVK